MSESSSKVLHDEDIADLAGVVAEDEAAYAGHAGQQDGDCPDGHSLPENDQFNPPTIRKNNAEDAHI